MLWDNDVDNDAADDAKWRMSSVDGLDTHIARS